MAIKITPVPENYGLDNPPVAPGELEDEGGGMALNAQARAALMMKLDRSGAGAGLPVLASPAVTPAQAAMGLLTSSNPLAAMAMRPGILPAVPGAAVPLVQPGAMAAAAAAALASNPVAAAAAAAVSAGPPSECLLLTNMFGQDEIMDDDFVQDVTEDVEEECSKFGAVKKVVVDRNSAGHVYVRFDTIAAANTARQTLHNRFFGGKSISATFLPLDEYIQRFGDS
eukprot:TRINITY_DN22771_c0_g2_i1.p2 TRINITY_DN22771_c0_g2~~TRINITY_DN22771_c0_g2_i1.p2  ORF type:complete len:238 (-),score=32.32 TRINITY_DN22771_c0_g2_i1:840-1517(-)